MADRKERWGRRAYLRGFQKTASGEYIYTGETYRFVEQGMTRTRALAVLWALTAGMAAAAIAAGCMPTAGMQNCVYVIIPYAGSLVALVSVVWAMFRLSAGGDPMRDYDYKASVGQHKVRSILVLVFTGGTILGEAVCLIRHGAGDALPATAAFLLSEVLLFVLTFMWKSVLSRLKWSK